MNGLSLILLAGAAVGAGAALVVWLLVPQDPDLEQALDRLSPEYARRAPAAAAAAAGDSRERLGGWAVRRLPPVLLARTPRRELSMLGVSEQRHLGEKVLYGLLGLVIGPALSVFLQVLGFVLPVQVPVVGSVAFAVFMFVVPDLEVAIAARRARTEFRRALSAYIDLVAQERAAGSGPQSALETAAAVGDSWVFARLREELARSRWSGVPPWESLRQLGDELGLPELADVADIMRISGEEGAQVYASLRARSAGLRHAILSDEHAAANALAEKMNIPMSLLGVIFMAILVTPPLLRMLEGS